MYHSSQDPNYPGNPYPPLPQVPSARRGRNRLPLILGAVAILVVVGGIIRFMSPSLTMRSFYDALAKGDYTTATNLICADQQASAQQGFAVLKGLNVTEDTSKLTYDIQSESLTTATIHTHGTVTISGSLLGISNTSTQTVDEMDQLKSAGLGWCLELSTRTNPAA